jgi:hypothetical protein
MKAMKKSTPHGLELRRNTLKRYVIYRLKMQELLHFQLLFMELNSGTICPKNIMDHDSAEFASSMRVAAVSWWVTFVDKNALNVFDLWRELFPRHKGRIDKLWEQIEPTWKVLVNYRNRCGFHADTPMRYFAAKAKLLDNGKQVTKDIQDFITLSVFLMRAEEKELPDFASAAEDLLLNVELKYGYGVNRSAFRKAGILPLSAKFKVVFP